MQPLEALQFSALLEFGAAGQSQTVTSPKLSSSSGCRAWLSFLSLWPSLALAGGDPLLGKCCYPRHIALNGITSSLMTSSPFLPQLQKGPDKIKCLRLYDFWVHGAEWNSVLHFHGTETSLDFS